jgi:hypothetical protein
VFKCFYKWELKWQIKVTCTSIYIWCPITRCKLTIDWNGKHLLNLTRNNVQKFITFVFSLKMLISLMVIRNILTITPNTQKIPYNIRSFLPRIYNSFIYSFWDFSLILWLIKIKSKLQFIFLVTFDSYDTHYIWLRILGILNQRILTLGNAKRRASLSYCSLNSSSLMVFPIRFSKT